MTVDIKETGLPVDNAPRVAANAWARLWARLIDMSVFGIVMGAAIALLLPAQVAMIENDALFGIVVLPFALALEIAVYAAFGTTLGKAIVGIDLATIRRDRVPLPLLVRRQALVWIYGLALGVPLFAIFTYILNAKKLAASKLTSWDEQYFTRVTGEPSAVRVSIAGLAWFVFVIGVSFLSAMAKEEARPLDEYSSPALVAEKLEGYAAAGRSGIPIQVDEVTRLDDVTADEGTRLTYHYTLNHMTAGREPVADVSARMRTHLNGTARSWYCEDPDQLGLRAAGLPVRYVYSDLEGGLVASVSYSPTDCA